MFLLCNVFAVKLSLKFHWNFNEISTKFQDKSEISRQIWNFKIGTMLPKWETHSPTVPLDSAPSIGPLFERRLPPRHRWDWGPPCGGSACRRQRPRPALFTPTSGLAGTGAPPIFLFVPMLDEMECFGLPWSLCTPMIPLYAMWWGAILPTKFFMPKIVKSFKWKNTGFFSSSPPPFYFQTSCRCGLEWQ